MLFFFAVGSYSSTQLGETLALPGLTSENRRGLSIPRASLSSHVSSGKGKHDQEEWEQKDQSSLQFKATLFFLPKLGYGKDVI